MMSLKHYIFIVVISLLSSCQYYDSTSKIEFDIFLPIRPREYTKFSIDDKYILGIDTLNKTLIFDGAIVDSVDTFFYSHSLYSSYIKISSGSNRPIYLTLIAPVQASIYSLESPFVYFNNKGTKNGCNSIFNKDNTLKVEKSYKYTRDLFSEDSWLVKKLMARQ